MKSIKGNALKIAVPVAVLLAIWTGSVVMAQRGPGGPDGSRPGPGMRDQGGPGGPGMMQPPPPMGTMKATADGVFVIVGGSLVKYDAATLKQSRQLKLVEQPKPTAGDESGPRPPMMGPTTLLVAPGDNGNLILVVAGDRFFSVKAASLELAAKCTLPAVKLPQSPQEQGQGDDDQQPMRPQRLGAPGAPPACLELVGRTLYIMRGPQIIAVKIDDATVAAQTTLPKPPAPLAPPNGD